MYEWGFHKFQLFDQAIQHYSLHFQLLTLAFLFSIVISSSNSLHIQRTGKKKVYLRIVNHIQLASN